MKNSAPLSDRIKFYREDATTEGFRCVLLHDMAEEIDRLNSIIEKCRIKSCSSEDGKVFWADCHDGKMMILHIELPTGERMMDGQYAAEKLSRKILMENQKVKDVLNSKGPQC